MSIVLAPCPSYEIVNAMVHTVLELLEWNIDDIMVS